MQNDAICVNNWYSYYNYQRSYYYVDHLIIYLSNYFCSTCLLKKERWSYQDFFLCRIIRNLQKNLDIKWQPPIFRLTNLPFLAKFFRSPIAINFENVRPLLSFMKEGGGGGVFELYNNKMTIGVVILTRETILIKW